MYDPSIGTISLNFRNMDCSIYSTIVTQSCERIKTYNLTLVHWFYVIILKIFSTSKSEYGVYLLICGDICVENQKIHNTDSSVTYNDGHYTFESEPLILKSWNLEDRYIL